MDTVQKGCTDSCSYIVTCSPPSDFHQWAVILDTPTNHLLACYAPAPNRRGIKQWCCLSDVWRLYVAYIGPKSRTERPRKTKIGTEVAHGTRDSDTTFKVKRSKVKVTRPLYSPRR